ncbi:MAG: hypothetical protein QNJ91_14480 [Gammaproteobacteria bacterium]|nr:hypothetical protein [Gammaproteobacteria bacterium]
MAERADNDPRHWVADARRLFPEQAPQHFTDYTHCDECAEHDATLCATDRDRIGLAELGNPGWDPLCLCSAEGLRYLVPALVRLTLDTLDDAGYVEQLLFHLSYAEHDNRLLGACNDAQRRFVADFLEHLITAHAAELDRFDCADDALRAHACWSQARGA